MKQFILTVLLFLFISLPVQTKVITGGVEMTVQEAREELLSDKIVLPDDENILNNFQDKNFQNNQSMLLKGVTALKDRKLARFSDGSYAVMYYDNPKNTYYYSSEGVLIYNEVKTGTEYPYKAYKYSPEGKLINMSLKLSKNETFIFNKSGKLLAHWLGENCYDEEDNVIMTRKIYE